MKKNLFTGHSLGGGLAACAVAQMTNGQAIVFNSAGLPSSYHGDLERFKRDQDSLKKDVLDLLDRPLILNYFMKHDPLTFFQSEYGRHTLDGMLHLTNITTKVAAMTSWPLFLLGKAAYNLMKYVQENAPLPPGSTICIDDDDFTLEKGNSRSMEGFKGIINKILNNKSTFGYISNFEKKEREDFKTVCSKKNEVFRKLGLEESWQNMYQKYAEYYDGRIDKDALRKAISNFMRESMALHLDGNQKLLGVLEDTKSSLKPIHRPMQIPTEHEQALFSPIRVLLRQLCALMQTLKPYLDFTPKGPAHSMLALLEELPHYLGRRDERLRREQQEDQKRQK